MTEEDVIGKYSFDETQDRDELNIFPVSRPVWLEGNCSSMRRLQVRVGKGSPEALQIKYVSPEDSSTEAMSPTCWKATLIATVIVPKINVR